MVYNIYINSKKCAKLSSSNILGNSNLSAVTPVPLTCKWLQHYGYDLGSKQKRFEAGQKENGLVGDKIRKLMPTKFTLLYKIVKNIGIEITEARLLI